MTNIKSIKIAINNLKCNYQIGSRTIAEENLKEQLKIIEFNLKKIKKDLKVLEILKYPVKEQIRDNEELYCQAYWNEYIGELCYGITYLVDGKEKFHSGTAKKPLKIDDVKKILEGLEK